jgi:2-phosphosulfolactate phosphatase
MINIRLYFTHYDVESELDLKDMNVVVIDVLRTSTTMITGLANGAKEIIPTENAASAGTIGRNSEGQSLLCGERNGKIIEGFNLGNSVGEYTADKVSDKNLIFCTTNGTPALMKSKFARNCFILGFTNMTRVVDHLYKMHEDFIILCSGRDGEFSLEDTVCAGMLIFMLEKKNEGDEFNLTDAARGALKLYSAYKKNLLDMLNESEHGKFLVGLSYGDDLVECAKIDTSPCLPVMRNGVIKLIEIFESDPKLTMKKVAQNNTK